MKVTAVLINVTGIQEYIFHSNKLRENIGASYIIEKEIYDKVMKTTLQTQFGGNFDMEVWKNRPHLVKMDEKNEIACEIGYIGGGNALLLFCPENEKKKEETNSYKFIQAFSKAVLAQFPGLRLVFGQKDDFELDNYKDEYQKLMEDLKKRKSQYIPMVSIQKHGITADCPWSNDSAEILYPPNKKVKPIFISKATSARIKATEMAQDDKEQKEMYPALGETYYLTDDIDMLGQENEKSYIAVVHIDGNGMGSIFSDINKLEDLREKSVAVSIKANEAMEKLIKQITKDYEDDNLFELAKYETKKENYKILPIRPILVGGDDVTFICEGRLGIYLAEKFIGFFYDDEQRNLPKEHPDRLMDGACAGVAIIKSHFPFYKAVELAEQLCVEAKKESRENKGSYISYYYSATTFSGSLAKLRERTHKTSDGKNLYFGPYRLFKSENYKENDSSHYIEDLKAGIKFFKGIDVPKEKQWANNKVMALREVLVEPLSSQNLFKKEMNIGMKKEKQEITFPNEKIEIWEGNKTPYFDQIELMDFYLPSLLP